MFRWLILLTMIPGLLTPQKVQSPAQVEFEYLLISIYPEYDQPEVLLIFQATIPASTSLPEQMSLRIPKDAQGFQLAYPGTNGLDNLPYTSAVEGDWLRINFRPVTNEIHWEYYDANLLKVKQQRNFDFKWPGDYGVKSLGIEVLQPVNATQMNINPNLGTGRQGDNGLTFYSAMIGANAAGSTFSLSLSYQKPDDTLVSSPNAITTKQPVSQSPTSQVIPSNYLPWLLGVLGVALIAGGVLWYWQSGRSSTGTIRRRHLETSKEDEEPSEADEGIYCHQCGKRATRGDTFCRSCGTKLRY